LVLAVALPEVPVTVSVKAPVAAVLLAVSVSVLPVVDEVGLNEAVTPLGKPVTENDTAPLIPLPDITVRVSVAVAPGITVSAAADPERVKPLVAVLAFELAKASFQGIRLYESFAYAAGSAPW